MANRNRLLRAIPRGKLHGRLILWLAAALLGPGGSGGLAQHAPAGPGSYELHPALEMSLFAREPDVVDPVALTFDEQGRLYVVEMRDYPYGFGPNRRPGGTIRLLEDTDGDGKIDRSVLFAEGLSFPTSIAPWRGGVLVAAPPEIIFLKDTDGDGKADVREVVLKGFTFGVTDSNVNGLRWGLDNRVHGVNGGNGGNVTSPRKPGPAVAIRNLDFSFDPATGDLIPTFHTSGGFGLVFDDWGRSFVTYNINHIQQRMIPARYLSRFPGLPPVEATESISDHEEMARIYPISTPETRVNHPEQSGRFSSAGGLGYIGTPAYAGDLRGSVLVCDVVGNLVHRDVLSPRGPSFIASRSKDEQTSEFFASRDHAFRPVGVEMGPDGGLYLIDMQRDVIEHPDYIPEKVKATLNLRAGDDRGRIYRITPKGGLPVVKPRLHRAATSELVAHLSDPNPWWRGTAQRLLIERQDRAAVPALKKLAASSSEPLARLHALWSLQGLQAADEPLALRALTDAQPGLRENALLLAEQLLPGSVRLRQQILKLAEDADPRVRFQASFTLGQFEQPPTQDALLKILLRDYPFRWSRLAALSSVRSGAEKLLTALLADDGFLQGLTDAKLALASELADLIGARAGSPKPPDFSGVLAALVAAGVDERIQIAALGGLQTGLDRAGGTPPVDAATTASLAKFSRQTSPALLAAAWKLARALRLPENDAQRSALARARQLSRDNSRPLEKRLQDIQLLGLGDFPTAGPTLLSLLEGPQPSAIQMAAIDALRQFTETEVAIGIVERWRALAPAVRSPVINLLLQRVSFHDVLVTAIEKEKIKLGELALDLEQRRRLLRESTPDIKARAAKFLGDEEYSNRKSVVTDWLGKLPANGDAARGRPIFEKTCAQCHLVAGIGTAVGPDLGAQAHRSVEDLASNILDPNMAINPAYISYLVETSTGEIENGILQSESAEAVTLLQALGKKVIVPRKQIKRLESTGLSLMPEGLEAGMTPADLRDLIAFLQERR